MEAVAEATQIPAKKQVLLIANGEPLNPSSRVGSYKSAGTVGLILDCLLFFISVPILWLEG